MPEFRDINSLVKHLRKDINDVDGGMDAFNIDFMKSIHIEKTMAEFLRDGGFDPTNFDSIDESELDKYIAQHTKFRSFSEMKTAAAKQYLEGKGYTVEV